ncbi:hypothetical protein DOY81_009237, partial [Sarcophaga bullata]
KLKFTTTTAAIDHNNTIKKTLLLIGIALIGPGLRGHESVALYNLTIALGGSDTGPGSNSGAR